MTDRKTNVSNLPAIALPGLPGSAPKLDRILIAAIRPTKRTRFVTDAQLDADPNAAASFFETWDVPDSITPQIVASAQDALNLWDAFMGRAPVGHIGQTNTIAEWLSQLGVLCAGPKMSVGDAKEKLAAYAGGLDYPQHCFSQKALYAAARHFKWFPTFSEVCQWLDVYVKPCRVMHDRIKALANAKPLLAAPAKTTSPLIRDMPLPQREEYLRQMRELRSTLEDAGVGNTERAAQARREADARNERQRALLAPILEQKRAALLGEENPET